MSAVATIDHVSMTNLGVDDFTLLAQFLDFAIAKVVAHTNLYQYGSSLQLWLLGNPIMGRGT